MRNGGSSQNGRGAFVVVRYAVNAVNIDQTIIPQTEVVKYLGLHFYCRWNWKEHVARKRNQIDL